MSYNGIGLSTARGTGTNGYVTRNLSALKPYKRYPQQQQEREEEEFVKEKQPNKDILNHEKKRKIEIVCLELQDELLDQGLSEQEIEEQVNQLRAELISKQQQEQVAMDPKKLLSHQSHQLAAAKIKANERFAKALKITSSTATSTKRDRSPLPPRERSRSPPPKKEYSRNKRYNSRSRSPPTKYRESSRGRDRSRVRSRSRSRDYKRHSPSPSSSSGSSR